MASSVERHVFIEAFALGGDSKLPLLCSCDHSVTMLFLMLQHRIFSFLLSGQIVLDISIQDSVTGALEWLVQTLHALCLRFVVFVVESAVSANEASSDFLALKHGVVAEFHWLNCASWHGIRIEKETSL